MSNQIEIENINTIYRPVAGDPGICIIRKIKGHTSKYYDLKIGDEVALLHGLPNRPERAFAREKLAVRSIATGKFNEIIVAHGHNLNIDSRFTPAAHVSSFYDRTDDADFIAIYFF